MPKYPAECSSVVDYIFEPIKFAYCAKNPLDDLCVYDIRDLYSYDILRTTIPLKGPFDSIKRAWLFMTIDSPLEFLSRYADIHVNNYYWFVAKKPASVFRKIDIKDLDHISQIATIVKIVDVTRMGNSDEFRIDIEEVSYGELVGLIKSKKGYVDFISKWSLGYDFLDTQSYILNLAKHYEDSIVKMYSILKSKRDTTMSQERNMRNMLTGRLMPKIDKIIYNGPATIIFWDDGSKTVVKADNDCVQDKTTGVAMAIAKKYVGNRYSSLEKLATSGEDQENKSKVKRSNAFNEICNWLVDLRALLNGNLTEQNPSRRYYNANGNMPFGNCEECSCDD